MKLFSRPADEVHPTKTALERRVTTLSTSELYRWLETTLAGIGQLTKEARQDIQHRPLLLQEAEEGAVAVAVVLRELQTR